MMHKVQYSISVFEHIVLCLLFVVIFFGYRQAYSQVETIVSSTSTPPFIVVEPDEQTKKIQFLTTPADLSLAGFSGIEEKKPLVNRFQVPVQYFKVDQDIVEKIPTNCIDCNNLVTVYVTPQLMTSPLWTVASNPHISKIEGRTEIKLFAAQRIIYVFAFNESAGRKLAQHLRERVVLNNTLIQK